MALTDICVNLTNGQFRGCEQEIMKRAQDAGVTRLVLTGTDLLSSRALLESNDGESIVSTAGIHPHDIGQADTDWADALDELLADPGIRAVGETGLDFNRNYSPVDQQMSGFRQQIRLAQQHALPLFVHDRDTEGVVLDTLHDAGDLPPVVVHCFTGTRQELERYLDAGFFIGITGWVADERRGAALRSLVPLIPLDRLMIETDAPFLRPHNAPADALLDHADKHGGKVNKRRNEPALLPYVLGAIAELRPEPATEIAAATHENAGKFFGLLAPER